MEFVPYSKIGFSSGFGAVMKVFVFFIVFFGTVCAFGTDVSVDTSSQSLLKGSLNGSLNAPSNGSQEMPSDSSKVIANDEIDKNLPAAQKVSIDTAEHALQPKTQNSKAARNEILEISLSRYARLEKGVLSKEYDLSGGRAYWINGISILGLPDVGAEVMGFSSPALRFPLGFSGLYTPPPIYERYGLSLNSSNGKILFNPPPIPIDTPTTSLVWERYAFDGNAFRLDFNRALLDSIGFSLGLSSHSVSSSGEFIYNDIVHNLFVGSFKRDSANVPFTGRNLGYNSIHLLPAVTWYMPHSSITAKFGYLFLDNDDATRDVFSKNESGTSILFPKDPYNIKGGANFYELSWRGSFLPHYELGIAHRIASQEFKYSGFDSADVYLPDAFDSSGAAVGKVKSVTEKFNAQSGEAGIFRSGFANPYIKVNYEFLENPDSSAFQDRELFLLGGRDTIWRLHLKGEAGLQRNSSAFNEVDFAPAFFGGATLVLPYHLSVNGSFQKDTRFPDINETHIMRFGRVAFPNPNLQEEKRMRFETNLAYKLSSRFFYEAGFRYEEAKNLIAPYWAVQHNEILDSIPVDSAFMLANTNGGNNELYFRLGLELGNWFFYAEHGKTFSRTKLINIPSRFWKATIYWSNRFVQNRLKVSVQFDADWFGDRWEYGIDSSNVARPMQLKHYLSLNFKSAMQIQDFILYARVENMNHSVMEPAIGYAPPGIRFAYGIEWKLMD